MMRKKKNNIKGVNKVWFLVVVVVVAYMEMMKMDDDGLLLSGEATLCGGEKMSVNIFARL